MVPFIQSHRKLTSIIAIVILMLTMLFNIYLLATPYSSPSGNGPTLSEDDINRRLPGFSAADGSDPITTNLLPSLNYALIGGSLTVILVGLIAIIVVIKFVDRKKLQQDILLKKQLAELAQVFEVYGQQQGHYPISSTYKPEYYSGVHMGQEWLAYGLPKDEEMSHYKSDWPIIDASKLSSVVYYPKQGGQSFALYSKIDTLPKEEAVDYNVEDNIPKAWGEFNFRLVSRGLSHQAPIINDMIEPILSPVVPEVANQVGLDNPEGDR